METFAPLCHLSRLFGPQFRLRLALVAFRSPRGEDHRASSKSSAGAPICFSRRGSIGSGIAGCLRRITHPHNISTHADPVRHWCRSPSAYVRTGTFSSISPIEISSYRYGGTLQPTCQYRNAGFGLFLRLQRAREERLPAARGADGENEKGRTRERSGAAQAGSRARSVTWPAGALGSDTCRIAPRQTGTAVDRTAGDGETWVWIITIPVGRYPAGDGDIGSQINTS